MIDKAFTIEMFRFSLVPVAVLFILTQSTEAAQREYTITASITDGYWDGTNAPQYVRIKGTQGVTEELQCVADFSRIGEDAECTVKSSRNIGDIKCIIWRTSSSNGWAFDKLKLKSGAFEKLNMGYTELDNSETKEFCFSGEDDEGCEKASAVCRPVQWLLIHLPDYHFAGTHGNIWMTLRQGPVTCTTEEIWKSPDIINKEYKKKPVGCSAIFNKNKKIDIWVYSDARNDIYIDKMGVQIGDTWHYWKSEDSPYVEIDSDKNNGWYTTD